MQMFSLEGKAALVTGGGKGIGRALALALAEAGADVAVASRTQSDLDKVAEEIRGKGRKALAVSADTVDRQSVANMVEKTVNEFGRIDILVNNAGYATTTPFLKITEEEWDRILNVNLKGYFFAAQAAGTHMLKARYGRIINVSSAMGTAPLGFMAHYAASKGGVDSMTKSLALEWANRGITVNAIAPGYFLTDITRSAHSDDKMNNLIVQKTPMGRWGELDELTGIVVYLASEASKYTTGAVIPVDGGWTAA